MLPNRIILVPEDFKGLVKILSADSNSLVQVSCSFGTNIMFSSPVNELYIRSSWRVIKGSSHPTLDLARIMLNNQGQGFGSKVVNWLKRYVARKGFTAIYIESIETNSMLALARKQGFAFDNDGGIGQFPGYWGNWSLLINN